MSVMRDWHLKELTDSGIRDGKHDALGCHKFGAKGQALGVGRSDRIAQVDPNVLVEVHDETTCHALRENSKRIMQASLQLFVSLFLGVLHGGHRKCILARRRRRWRHSGACVAIPARCFD
jgi:hypothetical protein